jgi:hemerythrin
VAIITWREQYRVGVPLIDAEHRYLFDLINEFHDAYGSGRTPREVLTLLTRLVAYAETHFQHEEALMRQARYPGLEQQQREHEKLYAAIYRLNEKLASNGVDIDHETTRFLKHWLADHILHEDLALGDFLKAHALRAGAADDEDAAAGPNPRLEAAA